MNRRNPCGRSWVERWDLGSGIPNRVVANTPNYWSKTVDRLEGHIRTQKVHGLLSKGGVNPHGNLGRNLGPRSGLPECGCPWNFERVAMDTNDVWNGGEATAYRHSVSIRTQKITCLRSRIRVNPRRRSWVGRMGFDLYAPSGVSEKSSSKWLETAKRHSADRPPQMVLDHRSERGRSPHGNLGRKGGPRSDLSECGSP